MHSTIIDNTCTCPSNSSLVNSVCICDKSDQQIIGGICQCPSGYIVINDTCHLVYEIKHKKLDLQCNQLVYTTVFNINDITTYITSQSNFSAGYVFSTIQLQNSFIDISDNVYQITVQPLFQSQNSFTNMKIQLGTQSLNNGSFILSSSTSITINQLNIISRPRSQLTVNAANLLNIITSVTTNANINNLLVNLSFATSHGNITLINNINVTLQISGYQVLGSYISTFTVAMIGINVNEATVNVNQVSFQVGTYNVGNGSSFMFGSAVDETSTLNINNMALILGDIQNFLLLGSIATNDKYTNYYQFGGIITWINSASTLKINNIILDSYQKFTTNYISFSGFLVGFLQYTVSSVSISNVCFQQNMTSVSEQFYWFGLIGKNQGSLNLLNASISFSVQGKDFYGFGIIGVQGYGSINAKIINLRTSVSVNSSYGGYQASVLGWEGAKNCSFINTSVIGGNITSNSQIIGGLIGCQDPNGNTTIFNTTIVDIIISGADRAGGFFGSKNPNSNTTILDSLISQSNISAGNSVGGFIGISQSTLYLINSKIQFVHLQGIGNVGIVVGFMNGGLFIFSNSSSASNYIQSTLQNDCILLSNIWSVVGC
ncbi:Hypothetical_protein [Hexamita inflata]|uniref:Hypothetical_protein n=1 Tax=Hexamita inflata TaxID=28002 RepID=A0AA86NAB8_9EUKA|nr:Hypothetical protein HINF_LOCUS3654 [Hexamita inflata]